MYRFFGFLRSNADYPLCQGLVKPIGRPAPVALWVYAASYKNRIHALARHHLVQRSRTAREDKLVTSEVAKVVKFASLSKPITKRSACKPASVRYEKLNCYSFAIVFLQVILFAAEIPNGNKLCLLCNGVLSRAA
jgi:hypothetical protein